MIRLVLAAWLCAPAARAEEPMPRIAAVSLDYRYLPPHALLRPRENVSNDASVRVRPYQIKARISRPWKLDSIDAVLTTIFGYDHLKFEYENWDSAMDPSRVDALHSLQFGLGFNKRLNERWAFKVIGGPTLNSDMKKVTAKAMRVQAMAGFEYSKTDHDKLGLGLAYAQVFGKNMVLPAISYLHRREAYRVEIIPPARMGAYWLPRKDLDLGMLLAFSGNHYRIEAPGEINGKYVEYSLGTLGPSLIWKLNKACTWTLDVGAVLRHRYALMDGQELYRSLDLKRSMFAAVGIKVGY